MKEFGDHCHLQTVAFFFFPDGPGMGHGTALTIPPVDTSGGKPKDGKVRRPPNSYILFSREWRRKLSTKHPGEKSSDISVR
jgi:hypothetical protein